MKTYQITYIEDDGHLEVGLKRGKENTYELLPMFYKSYLKVGDKFKVLPYKNNMHAAYILKREIYFKDEIDINDEINDFTNNISGILNGSFDKVRLNLFLAKYLISKKIIPTVSLKSNLMLYNSR